MSELNHPLPETIAFLSNATGQTNTTNTAAATAHIQTVAQAPFDVYYDPARKDFWMMNSRGQFIPINEQSTKRQLGTHGFPSRSYDGGLSPADKELARIQFENSVDYAGPLAGYMAGFYPHCAGQILVTQSPTLIDPGDGDWPVLRQLLENLFKGDDGHDQTPYVYGWFKVSLNSLRNRQRRPGQALCIAGPKGCGKSLFQNLTTPILGGRSAKPFRYMSGGTNFNADLFGAEHLMIEDECASRDNRTRRDFGAKIKEVVVNETQSCHGKHKQALTLAPLWRLTLSVNDEPENLLILPPLDESLRDKMMLLKAHCKPSPMPTFTDEQRAKYWQTLIAELSAFVAFLESFQIPPELECPRYGITHFHHPELLEAIDCLSDESKFLGIIDAELFSDPLDQKWTGTADELEKKLMNSSSRYETQKILSFRNACGTFLGRLANRFPDRIEPHRSRASRRWIIHWAKV